MLEASKDLLPEYNLNEPQPPEQEVKTLGPAWPCATGLSPLSAPVPFLTVLVNVTGKLRPPNPVLKACLQCVHSLCFCPLTPQCLLTGHRAPPLV